MRVSIAVSKRDLTRRNKTPIIIKNLHARTQQYFVRSCSVTKAKRRGKKKNILNQPSNQRASNAAQIRAASALCCHLADQRPSISKMWKKNFVEQTVGYILVISFFQLRRFTASVSRVLSVAPITDGCSGLASPVRLDMAAPSLKWIFFFYFVFFLYFFHRYILSIVRCYSSGCNDGAGWKACWKTAERSEDPWAVL